MARLYIDFLLTSCQLCLQIDTKDILFICGGAFVDIEKTISERYDIFLSSKQITFRS